MNNNNDSVEPMLTANSPQRPALYNSYFFGGCLNLLKNSTFQIFGNLDTFRLTCLPTFGQLLAKIPAKMSTDS